jgi:chromosome segregation ATPase
MDGEKENLAKQAVRLALEEEERDEDPQHQEEEREEGRACSAAAQKVDQHAGAEKLSSGGGNSEDSEDRSSWPSRGADCDSRLLRARLKAVKEELCKANRELSERDEQLARAEQSRKEAAAERDSAQKQLKQLHASHEKVKKRLESTKSSLQSKETEASELRQEIDKLSKEARAADSGSKGREARLNRALEEVERYKALLQEARQQQRHHPSEIKDSEVEKLQGEKKRLEQQKSELVTAFKKQMKLIDVLKRQKSHLQAARALQFCESEFINMLSEEEG